MTRSRFSRLAIVAAAAAILPACANSGIVVGGPGMQVGIPVRRTVAIADTVIDRLYFGRSISTGGEVTDSAWAAFLRDVVTPRFPAGLTFYRADGQWRDGGTIEREQTFVLEIVHPSGPAADVDLREIAAEYRRRFAQTAVLRATSPARVEIYH